MPWIRNKQTGEMVFVEDAPAAPTSIPIGPRNPAAPYQGPQASANVDKTYADIDSTRTGIARTNQQMQDDQARLSLQQQQFRAELIKNGMEIGPDGQVRPIQSAGRPQPGLTATERSGALNKYNSALALDTTIRDLERKFEAGPGSKGGLAGILDFLPLPANQDFYEAANQLRGDIKRAQGMTGGEVNTAAEMRLNYGPYIPSRTDYDSTARSKLETMRRMQQEAIRGAIAELGGVPDALGNVQQVDPSALRRPFTITAGPSLAGAGATRTQDPIPSDMQGEFEAFFARNSMADMTPDDYANLRVQLDQKYGFGAPSPAELDAYREEGQRLIDAARQGATIDLTIPGPERDLSAFDQTRNDFVNSPVGAFTAGAANMGGFGVPEAMNPQAFELLSESRPYSTGLGQIAGAIGGANALGRVGGAALGRFAPRAIPSSAMARNVATDAAYSGIYGGIAQDDPLMGAVEGGIGSTLGNIAGKGLSTAIGGLGNASLAQGLRNRGVPLTVGQAVGETGRIGRGVQSVEQRLSGLPVVGDTVRDRYTESMVGFNRAAIDEALAPVGGRSTGAGEKGVEAAKEIVSQAYEAALGGKNFPLDQQANDALAGIRNRMLSVPNIGESAAHQLDRALAHVKNGTLSGKDYQKARHVLDKASSKLTKSDALEGDEAIELLREAMDALDNAAMRSASPEIVTNLQRANQAWRNVSVVEDSVARARTGSMSGQPGIPTVSQLTDAAAANARRYGGGAGTTRRPFFELTQAGQQVLPNRVPDSGTAGRLALLGGGAALGGAAGGLSSGDDWSGGAQSGALSGAALAGLLMAGGSRNIQDLAIKGLFDRPQNLRAAGEILNRRKGLFGSATIPLFVGN